LSRSAPRTAGCDRPLASTLIHDAIGRGSAVSSVLTRGVLGPLPPVRFVDQLPQPPQGRWNRL